MKNAFKLPTALALSILTIPISSCTTERLNKAASTQGTIAAGISLPLLPGDCRKQEPHATVAAGAELRTIIVNERSALNRANARVGRCAAFYDDIKTNLEK